MRVLIFEPNLTGHHGPYLRHLICGLAALEQETVVATCPQATNSPYFELHLADVAGNVDFDESVLVGRKSTYRYAASMLRGLQRAVQVHRPDHVWVPYADLLTELLGARARCGLKVAWPEGVETEALFFRGRFAYPAERWSKLPTRWLSRRLIPRANWHLLHLLDPIPLQVLRRECPSLAGSLRLMPDPVEPVTAIQRGEARRRLGIPADGRWIGCTGVLDRRKGIDLLLAAFRRAELRDDDRLLLAGPMNEVLRTLVERDYQDLIQQGRVVTLDRHLSVEEVMQCVMASDVVCVASPFQMGSSSFVIRAAAANRPVLASNFGWTGWAVRQFELGWTTDVRNIEEFSTRLSEAVDAAGHHTPSAKAERFVRYHSPENFKAHWTSRLRERLGLPADEHEIAWDWVLSCPNGS